MQTLVHWQPILMAAATAAEVDGDPLGSASLLRHLIAAAIFSALGVVVLFICIWLIDRLSPYSFRKEILEDQNSAMGIIVGALLIGISIIIASAISG